MREANCSRSGDDGAALVEFAIASIVMLFIILFLVDLCFTIFHYAVLTHSVTHVTRRAAVDINDSPHVGA